MVKAYLEEEQKFLTNVKVVSISAILRNVNVIGNHTGYNIKLNDTITLILRII